MRVLGIRNTPSVIRYAVLDGDKNRSSLINGSEENRLIFPRDMTDINQRICWYKYEIERILSTYGKFDVVALKHNENIRSNYSRLRDTMYYDAILSLSASCNEIPVESFTYGSMKTNSKSIGSSCEALYEKTSFHWDAQMADAIYAAHTVIKR